MNDVHYSGDTELNKVAPNTRIYISDGTLIIANNVGDNVEIHHEGSGRIEIDGNLGVGSKIIAEKADIMVTRTLTGSNSIETGGTVRIDGAVGRGGSIVSNGAISIRGDVGSETLVQSKSSSVEVGGNISSRPPKARMSKIIASLDVRIKGIIGEQCSVKAELGGIVVDRQVWTNSTLEARKDIRVDEAINCKVTSTNGNINVRGRANGSTLRAGGYVSAGETNAKTVIESGVRDQSAQR